MSLQARSVSTPRYALPFWQAMDMHTEDLDPQQRFAEKERARRVDEQALRSGRKTKAQLKRETEAFTFPPSRARINLDASRSLS